MLSLQSWGNPVFWLRGGNGDRIYNQLGGDFVQMGFG